MFRIAGLFQEYGGLPLMLKPCLSWIDMWRTGRTPFDRAPLDPPALETGRCFPFVVVSDSTLSFRPSEVPAAGSKKKKDNQNLADVCNFFSASNN
eukprot:15473257-Alexandrium_andersonii.AAC.1